MQYRDVATLDIGWRGIGDEFGKHGVDAALAAVLSRCRRLTGVHTAESVGSFQIQLELGDPRSLDSVIASLQRSLLDDPVQATIGEREYLIKVVIAVVDDGAHPGGLLTH